MRTSSNGPLTRPRDVWAALGTGVILCGVVALAILFPVLGLIGAADAGTAGFLDVPAGPITVSIVLGYGLALVLLAGVLLTRRGGVAWILAVLAVLAAVAGSLLPLFLTASASVEQGQQILPFIADLVGRATGN